MRCSPLLLVLACLALPRICFGLSWERGWERREVAPANPPAVDAERAAQLSERVDSLPSVREAIAAWEMIAAADGQRPEPWIELAKLHLLEGAAYRTSRRERLACYRSALSASEKAMSLNPEFLAQVRSSVPPWEAARVLGANQVGAMNFWVTGIFYVFRDCLGPWGRARNAGLMKGARAMLEHMDAVSPGWEGEVSTFSKGIYYLAVPRFQGGDRDKARQYFEQAVNAAPNRTLARWGRGKYFYPAVGETDAARADLKAVADANLDQLAGDRAWNRYIKRDAAALLAKQAKK